MQEFIKYYETIKNQDFNKITEHSLRPALNELLLFIANEFNPKIKVINYLVWIWIRNGEIQRRETLCEDLTTFKRHLS